MKEKRLSKAKNLGVEKSYGKIIAFTDDDCLVSQDWLKNIHSKFKSNPRVVAIFGRVLAYKAKLYKNKFCPCIFLNNKKRVIVKPCVHWKYIGFGNIYS